MKELIIELIESKTYEIPGRGLRSRRSVCKERNGVVGSVARSFSFLIAWHHFHEIREIM